MTERRPGPPSNGATPETGVALARDLERVLRALAEEHERLRVINGARRRALQRADAPGLNACTAEENEVVQRIALLDRERAALALAADRRLGPAPAGGATLTWIADRMPEPERTRVVGLAATLKDLIARTRQERAAVGQAAEALASHMRGIARAVERTLAGASAYSRSGAAPSGAALSLGALDVTS